MVVALSLAFLVIICFMIFNKNSPGARGGSGGDGTNQYPQSQFAQGTPAALPYVVGQTYVCPKCGWRGNRMALDELGNCVCPQCGYCAYKKNVQTSQGVDAISNASPNKSVVKPIGIEVKDMLGGVMACAVYGNSWAEKAGMKRGDFIIRFNHEDIQYVNQLMDLVAKAPPEKRVPTSVLRMGKKMTFDVWVGEGELEGVVLPTPATAAGWGLGFGPGPRYGVGQGFGQAGGYSVCPGCGFRMLCQNGQACALCPRCNNSMMPEASMSGAPPAFQRGRGQYPWCPPGAPINQGRSQASPGGSGQNPWCPPIQATGAAFQTGSGQNQWCPTR